MLSDKLRDLINTLNISYVEFAKKVGTDGGSISKYISGKTKPSKGLINSIVLVYNVNPEWMNGESDGPMFLDELSPKFNRLISDLRSLTDDQIDIIYDFMHYIIKVDNKLKEQHEK